MLRFSDEESDSIDESLFGVVAAAPERCDLPRNLVERRRHRASSKTAEEQRVTRSLILARAREKKASLRFSRVTKTIAETTVQTFEHLKHRCVVRRGIAKMAIKRKPLGAVELVMVDRGKHGGNRIAFTPGSMLDIAFDEIISRNCLAKKFAASPVQVSRIRCLVAAAIIEFQEMLLRKTSELLVAAPASLPRNPEIGAVRIITYSSMSVRWDETTHRVRFRLPGDVKEEVRLFHIMVSRRLYEIGMLMVVGERVMEVRRRFSPICAPVALPSPSAAHIHFALLKHAASKGFSDFERTMLEFKSRIDCEGVQHEHWPLMLWETDAATANEKLIAHREAEVERITGGTPLGVATLCGNHQNSLIDGSVSLQVGMENVKFLYTLASVFEYGAYWKRTHDAIGRFAQQVVVRRGNVPPRSAFAQELADYCVHHRDRLALASDESRDEEESGHIGKSRSGYAAAWEELLAVANTFDVMETGAPTHIVHWCNGPHCCNNFSIETTRRRLREAITRVFFGRRPTRPILQKWTKFGPPLDLFLAQFCFYKLPREIIAPAFAASPPRRGPDATVMDLVARGNVQSFFFIVSSNELAERFL